MGRKDHSCDSIADGRCTGCTAWADVQSADGDPLVSDRPVDLPLVAAASLLNKLHDKLKKYCFVVKYIIIYPIHGVPVG